MRIKVNEYSKSIHNRHLDIILFVIIIIKKDIILFQILFPKKREPVHKETVMLPNEQDDRHRRNHGNKNRYSWHPAVKNNEKSCTEDYHHCCY